MQLRSGLGERKATVKCVDIGKHEVLVVDTTADGINEVENRQSDLVQRMCSERNGYLVWDEAGEG